MSDIEIIARWLHDVHVLANAKHYPVLSAMAWKAVSDDTKRTYRNAAKVMLEKPHPLLQKTKKRA